MVFLYSDLRGKVGVGKNRKKKTMKGTNEAQEKKRARVRREIQK